MFKKYYKQQFQEVLNVPLQSSDGFGYDVVSMKLEQHQFTIPKALFEYYALAGCHWLNTSHNRLLTIEELEWVDDKLVFMEENQGIACWAINKTDVSKINPFVWQSANGIWYEEGIQLSQFIVAMWKWTLAREQE